MVTIPLTVLDDDIARDVAVTLSSQDLTARSVYEALDLAVPPGVDPMTTATDRFHPGTLLGAGLASRESSDDGAALEVAVVAGLDAGHSVRLSPGEHRLDIGDGAAWVLDACGPVRCRLPWHESGVTIEALGGAGGVVAVGAPIDPEAGEVGVLHRPPLAPRSATPQLLRRPPEVPPVAKPAPLSWAALLAPLPIAALMMVFFRPLFGLFAAFGPLFALARWAEGRRSYRRACAARHVQLAEQALQLRAERALVAEQLAVCRWVEHPHVAALWQRARHRSVRLWERRPGTTGFLQVTIGIGPDRITADAGTANADAGAGIARDETARDDAAVVTLRPVPHVLDLESTTGIGVHGGRDAALAVTRSLVLQLVTLHGPADLAVELMSPTGRLTDWDWIKWLPHLVEGPIQQGQDTALGPIRCLVVDDPSADVRSRYRELEESGHDVRVVAVAPHPTSLPAMCEILIHVDEYCEITRPTSERSVRVHPTGVAPVVAASWARELAAVIDPDAGGLSPTESPHSLLDLVGFSDGATLASHWRRRDPGAPPRASIATVDGEPFVIDLQADGPHALVGGTTGSGKSELLRTLVLALAADAPPEHLNLVLFDFKGGGAFDVCAGLPHVAGVVTDLDELMVSRAIDSLRIELQHREEILRSRQASAFAEAPDAFPRLVVVIDEFAVLATEYPELMRSLIDLAARGRSLAIHLILATQRPSGVVDQKIRANTNVRIALRMQDPHDSHDLLGTGEAALLDRRRPGRAIVSIGGDRPVTIQVAHASAKTQTETGCRVVPFDFRPTKLPEVVDAAPQGVCDLDVLVDGIEAASQGRQVAQPLWTEPLPDRLAWNRLETTEPETWPSLGRADVVETQEHRPWRWDPEQSGLVLYSASAQVGAALLQTLATRLATSFGPDRLHLYVFDGGAQAVTAIAELPHTGALVGSHELDRVDRTLRLFEATLAQRRTDAANVGPPSRGRTPAMMLLIDNIGSVLQAHSEAARLVIIERLEALARDGRALGIAMAVTARSARDVPHRLAQHLGTRLVGELADPAGALMLGLRPRDLDRVCGMQAMDPSSGSLIVIADPPDPSEMPDPAAPSGDGGRAPAVRALPTVLSSTDLAVPSSMGSRLRIPIGLSIDDVREVALELDQGEHGLVIGSAGSGRTSLLSLIADQLARPDVDEVVVWGPDSPATERLRELLSVDRPTVALIDDVERLGDEAAEALRQACRSDNPHLRLIVATSPDHVRSIRSPVADLRARGTGVILAGQASDSDLLRIPLTMLPGGSRIPGRAHVCSRGHAVGAHLATLPTAQEPGR